jgi:hypothetical protein
MIPVRSLAPLLLTTACALLASCSPPGDPDFVQIKNSTDRAIRVELYTLEPGGEKRAYSTSFLAHGGTYSFGADATDPLRGLRARLTLQDEPADNPYNAVNLNVSEDNNRYYDLRLINNHLVAKRLTKTQADESKPE